MLEESGTRVLKERGEFKRKIKKPEQKVKDKQKTEKKYI